MTHAELQQLTDIGHDLTAKVALGLISDAQVGPTQKTQQVDNVTLGLIARTLGMVTTHTLAIITDSRSIQSILR